VAQEEPVATEGPKEQADEEGGPPGLALHGAEAGLRVDEGLVADAGDPRAWFDQDTVAIVAVVGLQALRHVGGGDEGSKGGEGGGRGDGWCLW